jgi:hypothetical protein
LHCNRGFTDDLEGMDWAGPAAHFEESEIVEPEPGCRTGRTLGDDHRSRSGQFLQAGCDVEHVAGKRSEIWLITDRGQEITRIDADPCLQIDPESLSHRVAQAINTGENRGGSLERSLGIVLMGCRESEDSEDSVTDERTHRSISFGQFPSYGVMYGTDHSRQILRIQRLGKTGGSNQIDIERSDQAMLEGCRRLAYRPSA